MKLGGKTTVGEVLSRRDLLRQNRRAHQIDLARKRLSLYAASAGTDKDLEDLRADLADMKLHREQIRACRALIETPATPGEDDKMRLASKLLGEMASQA